MKPVVTVQRLRDGNIDPVGRTTTHGFIIAVSDGRGGQKPWGDQFFQTEDAASSTAKACVIERCEIKHARRITYMNGRPPKSQLTFKSTIIIDDRGPNAENS